MKNLLLYFYLACFVLLAVLGVTWLILGEEYMIYAVLLQLLWGPVSVLHCMYKVAVARDKKEVGGLYKVSLALTVAYFIGLFLVASLPASVPYIDERALVVMGIGVLPWTMLTYFVYILYKEKNLPPEAPFSIEDDLIKDKI